MRKLILFFSVITLIYSCKGNADKYSNIYSLSDLNLEEEVMPVARQMNTPSAFSEQQPASQIEKKIIKDANVGVEVVDYKVFRIKLDSVVRTLNGYVATDNLYNNDQSINCDIAIRIPEKNFEKFLTYLEKVDAKTLYKNVSSRDVTEEFIDIEARLKNKKSVEKRYSQLLSKAKTVKDILEIEEKLRVIREEIESTQGRLNYLSSQVSFSTINLHITQKLDFKYQPTKEKNFFQLLIKSLDRGWKVLLQFLLFIVKLWPFLIIIVVAFYIYSRLRKKGKGKTKKG